MSKKQNIEFEFLLASFTFDIAIENDELAKDIEIDLYDGGPLDLPGYDHFVYVDLATMTTQSKDGHLPILWEHNPEAAVGIGLAVITKDGIRVVEGNLSLPGEHRDRIVKASQAGMKFEASLGAKMTQPAQYVAQGSSVRINGRDVSGPAFIASGTVLREASIVVMGRATSGSRSYIAASAGNTMNDFEKYVADVLGLDMSSMSEEAVDSLRATYEAAQSNVAAGDMDDDEVEAGGMKEETVQASATADPIAAQRKAMIAENKRLSRINSINASYSSVPDEKRESLLEQAIEGSLTADKFELELMRAQRDTPIATGVATVGGRHGFRNELAIEAAFLASHGMTNDKIAASMSADYSDSEVERAIDQATHREMRGMKLSKLCHAVFDSAGVTRPGSSYSADWFVQAKEISASGSTISLPRALGAGLERIAADAYAAQRDPILMACGEVDTNDLRPSEIIRATMSGGEVPDNPVGKELPQVAITEEVTSVKPRRKGERIVIDESVIINDDLNAVVDTTRRWSTKFATTLAADVSRLLGAAPTVSGSGTDSTFFASQKRKFMMPNYYDVSTTGPDDTTVEIAGRLFDEQTDSSGTPVGLGANYLLCSPTHGQSARRVYRSEKIVLSRSGSTDTETAIGDVNVHHDMYEPIVSRFVGKSAYHPSATTNPESIWYLLHKSTPSLSPVVIGYLSADNRGGRLPRIEEVASETMVAMTFKIWLYFRAVLHDRRLIVKMIG
ncbi:MAG: hypothetical protein AAFX06_10160 [Planctomycetota bacterium]